MNDVNQCGSANQKTCNCGPVLSKALRRSVSKAMLLEKWVRCGTRNVKWISNRMIGSDRKLIFLRSSSETIWGKNKCSIIRFLSNTGGNEFKSSAWILSRRPMSLLLECAHTILAYSKCDRTKDWNKFQSERINIFSHLLWTNPGIWFAFLVIVCSRIKFPVGAKCDS